MTIKKKATTKKAAKKADKRDEYGLTAKGREFADLYRGGPDDVRGNAKRCYMAIHPRAKERSAEVEGAKLLRKPEIAAYLEEQTEKVGKEADITQDRVLREMGRIGFFDPRKLFESDGTPKSIQDLDDNTVAAIAGLKVVQIGNADVGVGAVVEYKLANKNEALEKLAKYLGLYEKDNKQKGAALADILSSIDGKDTGLPDSTED